MAKKSVTFEKNVEKIHKSIQKSSELKNGVKTNKLEDILFSIHISIIFSSTKKFPL